MVPTMGRTVFWKNSMGETFPAVVVKVRTDELVDLGIFGSTYTVMANVPHGDGRDQWDWPPRIEVRGMPKAVEEIERQINAWGIPVEAVDPEPLKQDSMPEGSVSQEIRGPDLGQGDGGNPEDKAGWG